MVRHPIAVPDLGNVEAELTLFLRGLADRARPDLVRFPFKVGGDLADANLNFAEVRAEFTDDRLIRTILDRVVARGEVNPDWLTPRIAALPTDLTRHELLMTFAPPSDEVVRQIVEEIVLPLVRRQRRQPGT